MSKRYGFQLRSVNPDNKRIAGVPVGAHRTTPRALGAERKRARGWGSTCRAVPVRIIIAATAAARCADAAARRQPAGRMRRYTVSVAAAAIVSSPLTTLLFLPGLRRRNCGGMGRDGCARSACWLPWPRAAAALDLMPVFRQRGIVPAVRCTRAGSRWSRASSACSKAEERLVLPGVAAYARRTYRYRARCSVRRCCRGDRRLCRARRRARTQAAARRSELRGAGWLGTRFASRKLPLPRSVPYRRHFSPSRTFTAAVRR